MTGIVILAAGGSSRLGQPKQALEYKGKTLLQRAVNTALNSPCKPVIVVLGAFADGLLPLLINQKVQVVVNPDWQQGLASSIVLGITQLQQTGGIKGVVMMLCDQPFVDETIINHLLKLHQESKKGIIASTYQKTLGVPAYFSEKYFDELLMLKGNEGAKKLLSAYENDLMLHPFLLGSIDIDTRQDYENLKNKGD